MCNLTKLREEKKMSGSTHAQQISQTRARPTIVAVNRELLDAQVCWRRKVRFQSCYRFM
jgi:hypothetical protein